LGPLNSTLALYQDQARDYKSSTHREKSDQIGIGTQLCRSGKLRAAWSLPDLPKFFFFF